MKKTMISLVTAMTALGLTACIQEASPDGNKGTEDTAPVLDNNPEVEPQDPALQTAKVNFQFRFPEQASASVIQEDVQRLWVRVYPAKVDSWSEVIPSMGNDVPGFLGDFTDLLPFYSSEMRWPIEQRLLGRNYRSVSAFTLEREPGKELVSREVSLIPGSYVIIATQEIDNQQSHSSALVLTDLAEGENKVQVRMLAGTWDFAEPLIMDLFKDSEQFFNEEGEQVSVAGYLDDWGYTDLARGLQEGIKGVHLLNYGHGGIDPIVFDDVLLRVPVAGGGKGEIFVRGQDPSILMGDGYYDEDCYHDDYGSYCEGNGEAEFPTFMAGVIQQYYQDDDGKPVNHTHFHLGGILAFSYYELELDEGDEEADQFAMFFTLNDATLDYLTADDSDSLVLDGLYEQRDWNTGYEPLRYLRASWVARELERTGTLPENTLSTRVNSGTEIKGTMLSLVVKTTWQDCRHYDPESGDENSVCQELIDQPDLPDDLKGKRDAARLWRNNPQLGLQAANQLQLQQLAEQAGLVATGSAVLTEKPQSCMRIDETAIRYEDAEYFWDTQEQVWKAGSINPFSITVNYEDGKSLPWFADFDDTDSINPADNYVVFNGIYNNVFDQLAPLSSSSAVFDRQVDVSDLFCPSWGSCPDVVLLEDDDKVFFALVNDDAVRWRPEQDAPEEDDLLREVEQQISSSSNEAPVIWIQYHKQDDEWVVTENTAWLYEGLDSQKAMQLRKNLKIEGFSHSGWNDWQMNLMIPYFLSGHYCETSQPDLACYYRFNSGNEVEDETPVITLTPFEDQLAVNSTSFEEIQLCWQPFTLHGRSFDPSLFSAGTVVGFD